MLHLGISQVMRASDLRIGNSSGIATQGRTWYEVVVVSYRTKHLVLITWYNVLGYKYLKSLGTKYLSPST